MSKILFCHIPKCGGTSVNDALKQKPGYEWFVHRILQYDMHKYENYYKFSFIREPVQKLVSLYFYQINNFNILKKNNTLETAQEQNWFKLFKLYQKYNITNIRTFLDKYPEFYEKEIQPHIPNLKNINSRQNMCIWYVVGFLPQHLFICDDDDKILVNDVVNLKDINVFFQTKFRINVSKQNTHPKTNDNYVQYVTEKNMADIKKIYQKDYEIFGW